MPGECRIQGTPKTAEQAAPRLVQYEEVAALGICDEPKIVEDHLDLTAREVQDARFLNTDPATAGTCPTPLSNLT